MSRSLLDSSFRRHHNLLLAGASITDPIVKGKGGGNTAGKRHGKKNALWTPDDLSGVEAWWDAEQGKSFLGGRSTIADWVDRIGGYNLEQTNSSIEPYGRDTLNGIEIVTVQGVDEDRMTVPYSYFGTTFTLALVLSNFDGGDAYGRYISFGDTSTDNDSSATGIALFRDNLTNGIRMGAGTGSAATASPGYLTWGVWVTIFDGANVYHRWNGTQIGTGAHTSAFHIDRMAIFAESDVNLPQATGRGRIADIVTGHNGASTNEAQRLEGYLAHKYALTGNLPSGHPYKNSAPTV